MSASFAESPGSGKSARVMSGIVSPLALTLYSAASSSATSASVRVYIQSVDRAISGPFQFAAQSTGRSRISVIGASP